MQGSVSEFTARILFAGVIICALAVLLVGWAGQVPVLLSLTGGPALMVPSTAVGFVMLGAAALVRELKGLPSWAALSLVAFVGLIASADLLVILAGTANGIDAMIWPEEDTFSMASMSPATAVGFLFASVAMTRRITVDATRNDIVFDVAASAGLTLSAFVLIGYFFDAAAVHDVPLFSAMSLPTTVLFATLFSALLLSRPTAGWVAIILSDEPGSADARWLWPFLLVFTLLCTRLTLWATESGVFDANFRLSVLAGAGMLVLTTTVLFYAHLQNRVARKLKITASELEQAVQDRELLLRETNHRVKNNLQQINALLFIESGRLSDPSGKSAFRTMAGRVQALGHVHSLLMSSKHPSSISMPDFLGDLCRGIAASMFSDARHIVVKTRIDDHLLDIDRAMQIGLIANELVVNAFRHGFPDNKSGTITVELTETAGNQLTLAVKDNGVGLSADPSSGLPGDGAGSRILQSLAKQMKGSLSVHALPDGGTRAELTFINAKSKLAA